MNTTAFNKVYAAGNREVDRYRAILQGVSGSTFDERQKKLAQLRAAMSIPTPNRVHPPAMRVDWKPDEIENTTIFNY